MRAKVHRLEIDIDLIRSSDDLLAASSAAISANFDFSAERAGANNETRGFPGVVKTELAVPDGWLHQVMAQMVVLDAALSDMTPQEVLDRVGRSITDPNSKIPLAQRPTRDAAGDA